MPRVSTPLASAVGLVAALLPILAGCFGRARQPLPDPAGTSAATCRECHRAIYDEWQTSAHAAAFIREEFRLASKDHAEEKCLRCHIPASLERLNGAPVRQRHRKEGVNCESCHLKGDAYAAPTLFSAYSDHATVEEPLLADSAFCGTCHEAILKQWEAAPVAEAERKTCQECHMPSVRRRTVSGSVWHVLHPKAAGRRHDFAMVRPEPGEQHVELKLTLDEASPRTVTGTVTVTNVAAHHALPSGEFGFRELAVVVALVDRYGVASAKQVTRFVAQKRTWLPFREPRSVPIRFKAVPPDVEAVEVRLVRSSFAGVEAELARERRPLRSPSGAGQGE